VPHALPQLCKLLAQQGVHVRPVLEALSLESVSCLQCIVQSLQSGDRHIAAVRTTMLRESSCAPAIV